MTARRGARAAAAAVLAGLVALGLGACGSDPLSQEAYEREVAQLGEEAQERRAEIEGSPARSGEDIARQLRDSQELARELSADLDELEPPEEIADGHDELVSVIGDAADALDPLVEAAADGNLERLRELAADEDLGGDVRERQVRVRETFSEAGYDLGTLLQAQPGEGEAEGGGEGGAG